MLSFGIKIIIVLLLIAGVVAFVGDYIGKSIGRKRLSILKLRPRYTAIIFTIITGMLIAFTTILILLGISQDVRTALFGLEELKFTLKEKSHKLNETKKALSSRITEKEKIDEELLKSKFNLHKAKLEIQTLEKTKQKLKKEVEISRKGKVLFNVGDTLLVTIIQAGDKQNKLETELKQVLSATDAYVRSLGVKSDKHLIFVSPQEFEGAVSALQKSVGENIVKVVATRNTLFGEEVPAQFKIIKNNLIYKKDEKVAEITIIEKLSLPEIEQDVKRLLSLAHQAAKEAGVVPDINGSVGSVPYAKILATAKKIKAHKGGVILKAFSENNIYAIGPLEVKFRIYYQ